MGLVCTAASKIAFMATAYFIGYGFGASAYAMPDTIGRKKSCVFGFTLSLLCQTVMIWVPDYYVRTACFFGMGLC